MHTLHNIGNRFGLLAVCAILTVAFYYQFVLGEIPCPLCLLQRVLFVAVGIGLALNLRVGAKPAHYGVVLIAALVGFGMALRQVLLHITPGDPGFAMPLFGIHFYTWAMIAFLGVVAAVALALQFTFPAPTAEHRVEGCDKTIMALFALLVLVNAIAAFLECGIYACPGDPTEYLLLQ